MPRAALKPAIAVVALVGAAWPVASRAQPREVTLPRLEVPDEAKTRKPSTVPDRAALLSQPIELSDERDRLTLARERAAWGRLSGSLCTGCGPVRSQGRVATVDPIAVLNAKPAAAPVVRALRPATIVAARAAPAQIVAGATPVRVVAGATAIQAAARLAPAPAQPVQAARPGPVLVAAASGPATKAVRRRPAFAVRRLSRPAHTHRVQLAHRRGSRSRYAGYLGRVRYALLRWRHQHHHRQHHRRFHR